MKQTSHSLLLKQIALAAALSLSASLLFGADTPAPTTKGIGNTHVSPEKMIRNTPAMVEADGRLRLDFGDEQMALDGGLQPSLLCTSSGTLVMQAQAPEKPFDSSRMHYPYAMSTVVSRDGGKRWTHIPLKPGENGLNMEGGVVQLRDGTILALDTYIIPGKRPGEGIGQLYASTDDWRTLQGPEDVTFDLPRVNFYASKDDGGHPHDAQRLHRRILELPNGDLLTTFYGQLEGDNTPSTYMLTMMKARTMLVRSADRGRHWKLVSTVAVGPSIGTEGFGEPVLARVSKGEHAGRLICLMRTGRELYEAISDDEGATWSSARPRVFAGLDVYRTELWVDMFRHLTRKGKSLDENNPDELRGAVVDPDLIELRSGVLVAAFGVRVPQKGCWQLSTHPWNGNYLAFSLDHGETWTNVVRMTSGVPTTHYMAIEETPNDNELFVTYDYGFWGRPTRYVYGRSVKVTLKSDNGAGTRTTSALTGPVSAQDVDDFWRITRERLAREPMDARVEPVADALPYRKFKITLHSLDSVPVRAWLALPIKGEGPAKPWPVIITAPGYGGPQQGVMLNECERGYAILQVFPRSQGDSAELWKIDGPDKLTWHLGRPEGTYYQGAYADMIRAIDFVVSREDLDASRIALVGTSQGGGISLAVAALDSRVKAVIAHVPFLCNFRLAASTPNSLVKKLLDQAGRNDEAALRTLAYFDPWQLAPLLRVPVLMSAGGKDEVCPLPTIQSVYDRLPGTKALMIYPNLPHTTCLDFYAISWPWLDLHFRQQI